MGIEEMTQYPAGDDLYEEVTIAAVEPTASGWNIKRSDHWSFSVPDGPVVPTVGSTARFYGRGIGSTVRGLFIDGACVFYRTEAEDKEHHAILSFGKDAADVLARWDAGQLVWTVSMGGFGPGYEQAIQVAAFEVVRYFLAEQADVSSEAWEKTREAADKALLPVLSPLGLSGMQWGAALHLGTRIYRDGPRVVHDTAHEDRRIMVSDHWPSLKHKAVQEH